MAIVLQARDYFFDTPTIIVDRFIHTATHFQLKLILWIAKNSGKSYEKEFICSYFDVTEAQLFEALNFWSENNVLTEKNGSYLLGSGYAGDDSESYSISYVIKRKETDKNLSEMLIRAESLMGKTFSTGEIIKLFTLHERDGMDYDIILLMIAYCINIGKKGMSAIENTGAHWIKIGIDTHEKAENFIKTALERHDVKNQLSRIVGAGTRALTAAENKNFDIWLNEYGFTLDLIKLAYDKTIDNTGVYKNSYMNSILKKWHESGIKTESDIELLDKKPAFVKPQANAKPRKKTNIDMEEYKELSWRIFEDDLKD